MSNELDVQNEWEKNTYTHTHCTINIKRAMVVTASSGKCYVVYKQGLPWPISVGKNFPTGILLISSKFFAENGLSTEMGGNFVAIKKFRGNVPDI